MTQTPVHRRIRRRMMVPAVSAVLLLAGAGTALADGDSDRRYRRAEHRYDDHRGHRHGSSCDIDRRGHRRHHRYDRHRGHRRHHRYDNSHGYRDRHRRHTYDRYRRYDRPRRYHYRDHGYRHYDHGYGHGHRRFSIPRLIARELAHELAHYFIGRLYYADHRHHHTIYRFPHYDDHGAVSYRPYAYCEGKYFAVGTYRHGDPYFDGHSPY